MFGSLQNFRQVTVTLGATDQGKGHMILGANENPLWILACSVYSGTNTAASTMGLYVIPSQTPASASEFDFTLGGQDGIQAIQGTSPMNLCVNLGTAQGFIPSVDTRAGGTWLLLPPYALLVIAPSTADLNGTIIASVSSAELC